MYQAPRGTVDILPGEQSFWQHVQQIAAGTAGLYGYRKIDTPSFEDARLFSRSAGEYTDIVQKEMYTFEDRGGNSLSLRPEGTPSVCRAYIQHGMHNSPQPVKLYYITSIFRYDRPQAGRQRQHHQFGCEAIGEADPALDAEVIEVAWRLYDTLGLKRLSIHLNSIGCRLCRPVYLEALKGCYNGYTDRLCNDCKTRMVNNPLRLLDCKQPRCQEAADSAAKSVDFLCPECRDHMERVSGYLETMGLPFKLNHRLVRGLDYYTRTVFEIQPEDDRAQSTIGGGGRYDYLIEELGGKPTPAVGFATGIERIILNMKNQGIGVPDLPDPGVFIARLGDEAGRMAVKLGSDLRKAGISVINAYGARSLKAQLRQANSLGAGYAVIIGDDEARSGTAILRNMADASQQTLPLEKLAEVLEQRCVMQ